ncbi:MAG: transaldolase [Myxococcales bacterium]|nr:transaldolase [Myxococcota bacterium]MDW8280922.1 transaldolase [Myxococcales bacterium]
MAEPASLLDQLKQMTVVVADTGDIQSIEKFRPRDATTNPSLLMAAAQMPEYQDLIDEALRWAHARSASDMERLLRLAADRLAVEFGLRILDIVEGRVSTEVDARLSYDTAATIDKARLLIQLYEDSGASRERVLIKIASTWEGIRAAEVLEREGIHCNLTLLFGLHQAVACAEAGVTLISPFVGRILDWYLQEERRESFAPPEDPGVLSVTKIYNYFKHFEYKTEVMGASFRNTGQIIELAGCDLLTISPKLLGELAGMQGELQRKLCPQRAAAMQMERQHMDEQAFRLAHSRNRMATEKLHQGIFDFGKATESLELHLARRLRALDL